MSDKLFETWERTVEKKPVQVLTWGARCAGCGRQNFVRVIRPDGPNKFTEWLLRYREDGPLVCSPQCDRKIPKILTLEQI